MSGELLDRVPLSGLLIIVLATFLLALEVGYRLGQWRHQRAADEKEVPVGSMVAAILGLLAFLIGFTFSLAAARFEARREAVFEEANAIDTTYLRAHLLPEPEASEAKRLLREYIDVRVQALQKGRDLNASIAQSEQLHQVLWDQARSAASKDSHSVMTALFIDTLNDVIDLHAKRIFVGLRSRIPIAIWAVLLILAVLGLGSVGYQSGLSVTRRSPAMIVLVMAFTGVLVLIADLDRGQEGLLRVSQQALIDAQSTMLPR